MSIKGWFSTSFRKKDDSSQKLLYEMFYKRVYNTAYFVTKDAYLADDVVQETFIKAFRNMEKITDSEKVGAWLSVIATRTAIDLLKKQKGHIVSLVDPGILELEIDKNYSYNEADLFTMKESVRELINELSPEYRAVIILKYLYDKKEEEVAAELGIGIGTVKSRIFRAKNKMRQSIIGREQVGGDNYEKV